MSNRSKDWLTQAERDLQKAEVDLKHSFYEWVCFTCQQAAEKAVKALIYQQNGDPWGHSILGLMKLIRDRLPIPEMVLEYAQLLDSYYISARYPNGWFEGKPADYFNEKKAREALNAAQEICRFIRDLLSGEGKNP